MTAIYLAWNGNTVANKTLVEWDWRNRPLHILVAFPYLSAYQRSSREYGTPLSTFLDSGAFSAWKSGKVVDIDRLIHEVKTGGWDECVALDVIGDSRGSVRNAFYMKDRGCDALIPVFHYGEDWGVLREYCRAFARVGLSCRFGEPLKQSIRWVEQCFARQWPHCFHSFGWISEQILDRVPFDTADAATWQLGPAAFGTWRSYNGAKLSIPSSLKTGVRFRTEVEYYLSKQLRLEDRWKKELEPLRRRILDDKLASRRMLSTWSPGKVSAPSM